MPVNGFGSVDEFADYTVLHFDFTDKVIIMPHPDYGTDNQVGSEYNQNEIEYPQRNEKGQDIKKVIIF